MLQTSRLHLRELNLHDCPALQEIESDPLVTRYLSFDPRTLAEIRTYIETALRDQQSSPRLTYDFAITLLPATARGLSFAPDALIGRCGLAIRRPEHREAIVWYELHPAATRHGYAFEAATAVLEFGFQELNLHRIWADCDPRNLASCRVAQRLGMLLEGQVRENYFLKGEWCSTAIYGMLEHEWRIYRQTAKEPG